MRLPSERSGRSRFSEDTVRLLRDAGWHPNRVVDASEMVEWLRQRGYEVTEPIQDFLKEFGNLTLCRANGRPAIYLNFDYLNTFEEDMEIIREHLGLSLCPIGNTSGSVLLMSPEGTVYDTDGGTYFDLVSRSADEAIDTILRSKYDEREQLLDIHQFIEILRLPPLPDDYPD